MPGNGPPWHSAERVNRWAKSHFTRDNAVLWVVGDAVPEGLRLTLPAGQPNPLPAVTSALPRTPAWFHAPRDVIYLHALVPRSTAAMVFARVLGKALFTDLRQRGGYSYTAQADYHPIGRDIGAVVAIADSAPDKQEAALGAFIDVLARLRFGTISQAESETAKSSIMNELDDPDAAQLLPGYAVATLIGRPPQSPEELRAEVAAVAIADLQQVAEQVHADALIQVPTLGLDWAGVSAVPLYSDGAVWGREYPAFDDDGGALIVGNQGVSVQAGEQALTVYYSECVAIQVYPDGGRRLFGRDGISVAVEPTLYRLDAGVPDEVVNAVSASAVISMPPRHQDEIPRPSGALEPARRLARPHRVSGPISSPSTVMTVLRRSAFVITWLIAAFLFILALAGTIGAAQGDPELDFGGAAFTWGLFAIPAWLTWKLRRPRAKVV